MYDVVRVVYLDVPAGGVPDPVVVDTLLARLRAVAAEATASPPVVEPTLPGARNGGELLLRLRYPSAEAWRRARPALDGVLADPAVARVTGAGFDPAAGAAPAAGTGGTGPTAGGVYRALLLRVHDGAAPDEVAALERALLRLPRHIPQIRSWRLVRVAAAEGDTAWTHVWEQEFDRLDDLLGPYMTHPVHWAHVDRWFDPESPLWLVRDRVCHTFCALDQPVLTTR